MGKVTEREFKSRVEYYEHQDKHGKVFLPNSLFETLLKEESLTTKGKEPQHMLMLHIHICILLHGCTVTLNTVL
ncbi:hypothetical protein ACT7CM_14585 [Bacillus paranthracis]